MSKEDYLPRYRHPKTIIRFAVCQNMFHSARDVAIIVFFTFKVAVSHKTICEWTKKFIRNVEFPVIKYGDETLICHADEKYVKINGEWHFWWSIKDCFGNLIHKIITPSRDFESAKRFFKEARRKINRDVNVLVRDGLPAYDRATKFLGRKCKSLVSGIKGKPIIFNKEFYWLTNNPIESLNSEIDFYLGRFRNNFANLESANRFADIFMLRKHLKKLFAEKKLSEASSLLTQAINF